MQEKQDSEITKEKLVKLIHNFSNDPYIQFIKERDKTKSMMEIVGVNRKENNHSDFLAWLFDSSSDHQLGAKPADKLIKLLANKRCVSEGSKKSSKNDISDDELLAFLIGSNEIIESKSSREVSLDNGRVDIIIELKAKDIPNNIRVVYENKVAAVETNGDQTKRYYEYYSEKKDDYKNIYVFNRCNDSKPKYDTFICTTYQDIVDHIIEPLLQFPNINERTQFILKDYILSLEKPASEDKLIDKIIMAIGKDSAELLADFWENNSELISQVAQSLERKYPNNKEYKQFATATKNARNYDKYAVNGEGRYGKARMVEAVVNLYISNHPNITAEELKSVFPDYLTPLGVIKSSEEEVKDISRWYSSNLSNKKKCYICNQWNFNTISKFIYHIHTNIEGIKITNVD